MQPVEMAPGIYWTGALDPLLRTFDVIMHAEHGTTYNSYLVQGTRSCALLETVKAKFADSLIENLSTLVDPLSIDYLIVNHTEPDHTGSLRRLLDEIPSIKIVAAKNTVPFIRGILNEDVEVTVVKDGDTIDLGGKTLTFFEAPFLHWPDTMFTYVKEDQILFPCDFLGSHYADEKLFGDLLDDFSFSRKYYFDHIFRPFKEFVNRGLDKIQDLPLKMIGPSHGPILRKDVGKYLDEYRQWAAPVEKGDKPRLMIFYASSYGNTLKLAENIAEGARENGVEVTIFDLEVSEPGALLDEVERADGVAVGSCTINGDAVKPVWNFLSSLATLKLRGKVGAAFGSYGWSGEAVKMIEDRLRGIKFKIPAEGVKAHLVPSDDELGKARELGVALAKALVS